MENIIIIDYGVGNLRSVKKAFKRAGCEVKISANENDIIQADKLVLPGVGHFYEGMKKLKEANLISILNEQVVNKKKPILGICLGMQLMTKFSEEGNIQGLGWINAKTKKFDINLKVPHIGWNTIEWKQNSLMKGLNVKDDYYFTHSYYVIANNEDNQILYTNYEIKFVSGFANENIYGVQFHPEKSHNAGIALIKNFINL